MKHPIEKPSERIMRFFTPELYMQFNSADDATADAANEAWETALRDYQSHLDAIRDRMPAQVRRLAELCLHDAEILGFDQETQSLFPGPESLSPVPLWSVVAILSVEQAGSLRYVIFTLWDRVREYPASAAWPFSKARKHWLYDEVDVATDRREMFLHRILFSDGSVVEIPFASVITSTLALPGADAASAARRTA
jgi:hypothetical protein